MNIDTIIKQASIKKLFGFLINKRIMRSKVIDLIQKRIYKAVMENNSDDRPRHVQEEKYNYLVALTHSIDQGIERGFISKHVVNRLMDVFLENVILNAKKQEKEIANSLGFKPPLFLLVSPTGKCNLRCKGCYAESDPGNHASLDFNTFDRILTEKEDLWGSYFTVISGGEPFMWRDGERSLLDIAAKHSSNLFLVYTNGTFITDDVAKRMGELGNITPSISLEGFEEETDARRGKGVYQKILAAFENLRRHGVPFGISATPTRDNWQIITSDRFVNFYFDQENAIYGWLFQYMPIGRGQSLDLMVSPGHRIEMFKRMRRLVRERKIFLADFWNSGMVSSGCIAAGRPGGYFYIDWNGDVSPCAFVPYATGNIHKIYANGGTINTARNTALLARIRAWQNEYGYAQPAKKVQNWLCPCVIRDHFELLKEAVSETNAMPINEEAAIAMEDQDYYQGMVYYGKEIERLTAPIWAGEYSEK